MYTCEINHGSGNRKGWDELIKVSCFYEDQLVSRMLRIKDEAKLTVPQD